MTAVRAFGATAAGETVHAIDLSAGQIRATILTLGATLNDLRLAGTPWPLVLGGTTAADYEGPMAYFGAIVGPVANRIAGAAATVGGRTLRLDANEAGRTTLHGGRNGTSTRVWTLERSSAAEAVLSLGLGDGDGGFPGDRHIVARFRAVPPATLALDLTATTDRPTLMTLAHHSYWNLDGTADTAGHVLSVAADTYLPVDDRLIPDGGPAPVTGTHFDFRRGRVLDARPRYDHNLCLAAARRSLTAVAELRGQSGVSLTVSTTEPGLQVYDGQGLGTAPRPGLTGRPYGPFAGVALEPQVWPDAPNRPDFPSAALEPGETYRQSLRLTLARGESG